MEWIAMSEMERRNLDLARRVNSHKPHQADNMTDFQRLVDAFNSGDSYRWGQTLFAVIFPKTFLLVDAFVRWCGSKNLGSPHYIYMENMLRFTVGLQNRLDLRFRLQWSQYDHDLVLFSDRYNSATGMCDDYNCCAGSEEAVWIIANKMASYARIGATPRLYQQIRKELERYVMFEQKAYIKYLAQVALECNSKGGCYACNPKFGPVGCKTKKGLVGFPLKGRARSYHSKEETGSCHVICQSHDGNLVWPGQVSMKDVWNNEFRPRFNTKD